MRRRTASPGSVLAAGARRRLAPARAAVAQQRVESLGGRADALEVGQQRGRRRLSAARRRSASPRRADALEGWASVPRAAARSGGPRLTSRQHLVQQGQELARVGAERR